MNLICTKGASITFNVEDVSTVKLSSLDGVNVTFRARGSVSFLSVTTEEIIKVPDDALLAKVASSLTDVEVTL